jgi:hypothetical protein
MTRAKTSNPTGQSRWCSIRKEWVMKTAILTQVVGIIALSIYTAQTQTNGDVLGSLTGPLPTGATNALEAAARAQLPLATQLLIVASPAPVTNAGVAQTPFVSQLEPPAPASGPEELLISGNVAVAHFGPFNTTFAANANTPGAVELVLPGRAGVIRVRSHVAGLCYYDYQTGEAVQFATLQDSIAQVLPPRTVYFTNALSGVEADIRYTCSAEGASFEQDIVLRQHLPDPRRLGFDNSETVVLGVMTELLEGPLPIRSAKTLDLRSEKAVLNASGPDTLDSEDLFFGAMRLVSSGRAFLLGNSAADVPTAARMVEISGRRFIVESVPYPLIAAQMAALPEGTLHASATRRGSLRTLLAGVPSPSSRDLSSVKPTLLAGSSIDSRPGFVLDYLMVSARVGNVDFGAPYPAKSGFAAVGQTPSDPWMPFWFPNAHIATRNGLQWSDYSVTSTGITVSNAPGCWTWDAGDPMYSTYIYASPGQGNVTLTITNLPADVYHIYLYGHAGGTTKNASFKLYRAGVQLGYKGTTLWGSGWNSTNWEAGQQYVVFKNVAVTNQALDIVIPPGSDGYCYLNGLQIVASAGVPPDSSTPTALVNVDLATISTTKTGPAATGITDTDFWNSFASPALHSGSTVPLKYSDASDSPAGMTVWNAPGCWGNGVSEPMYNNYVYAYDGGNVTVAITNLPAGNYDLYLYGHSAADYANALFQVWTGARDCGFKATSIWGSGWNSAVWDEGQQFVVFRDLWVQEGQPLTIVAGHDTDGYANFSGFQLAFKGSADANNNGLPDAWEQYFFGNLNHTADEDFDGDGLSNLREYELGFNPTKADTDTNGVSDGAECELAWIEDSAPTGAHLAGSNESWQWVSSFQDPDGWWGTRVLPHSGQLMHLSGLYNGAAHQHSLYTPDQNFLVRTGDVLYAYVNLDPAHPPSEAMLQWYVLDATGHGTWEHRAYWGDNLISWGTDGTVTRLYVTNLPAAGNWARLEVPAASLGLEGQVIQGMAFVLWGGRAAWDRAGSSVPDMNANGIPDWWEWKYFNSLQPSEADYDGDGTSNKAAYLEGRDPNIIQFAVLVTNNYVSVSSVPLDLQLTGGVPGQRSILIDDTNFSAAAWTAYTPGGFTVAPGPAQGWHDVWIGLRGLSDDAQQTWVLKRLKMDVSPPLLIVTNPSSLDVSQGILELQGYSSEDLRTVSYDIANAAGLVTNLPVLTLDRVWDNTTGESTTNFFQGFDIKLAEGVNTITLHAADLAGNCAVSVLNYTLDYSRQATAPRVALYWPQDGTQVASPIITCRGTIDDFTASISATAIDAQNNQRTYTAIIERDGNFWIENIAIAPGSTQITLAFTNWAGKGDTFMFSISKAGNSISIDQPTEYELGQSKTTVTGSISTPGYKVWLNGIPATQPGDGTWRAEEVGMTPGGTAVLQARGIPLTDHNGDGSGPASISPAYNDLANPTSADAIDTEIQADKPPRMFIESYSSTENTVGSDTWNYYDSQGNSLCDDLWSGGTGSGNNQYNISWQDAGTANGSWNNHYSGSACLGTGTSGTCVGTITWPTTDWPSLEPGTQSATGDCDWGTFDPIAPPPGVAYEYCAVNVNDTWSWSHLPHDSGVWEEATIKETYSRTANAKVKFFTGGKSGPTQQTNPKILQFGATLTRSVRSSHSDVWIHYLPDGAIPPSRVTMAGKPLGSDGMAYLLTSDNVTQDITPRADGEDYYTFTAGASVHRLLHRTACATPPNTDRVKLGLGEAVDFYFDPPLAMTPPEAPVWFTLDGTLLPTTGSSTLYIAPQDETSTTVRVTIRDVSIETSFGVIPPSGISVVFLEDLGFGAPGESLMGAMSDFLVFLNPQDVSFVNAHLRENIPARHTQFPDGEFVDTDASTPDWGMDGICDIKFRDTIADAPIPIRLLFNGYMYLDFTHELDYNIEYNKRDSGSWIPCIHVQTATEFHGSTQQAREVYQGVPGGWQGPWAKP